MVLMEIMLINTGVFSTILVVLFFVWVSRTKNGDKVNGDLYKIKENVNSEDKMPVQRQALPDSKHSL